MPPKPGRHGWLGRQRRCVGCSTNTGCRPVDPAQLQEHHGSRRDREGCNRHRRHRRNRRAIATDLISHGAAVVGTYAKNEERAEQVSRELGSHFTALRSDSSDARSANQIVERVVTLHGRVDIVIANAGQTARSPLSATPDGTFERVFGANVQSVWQLFQSAGPVLSDDSRIIALSSVRTAMNTAGTALYTASKAAVEAMVRVLAVELGPQGTSVNAVAPGATDTDLLRSVNDQAAIDAMAAATPLRRVGLPGDISGIVTFLASPAGKWITGQTIYADGGLGT